MTTTPKNHNVLISGASVAGPALAYWLHRYGFRPTIVERAPALRDGGYAVDFRGDAHLSVLRQMGILGDIERERTNMGSIAYVNAAGKTVARMPADLFSGDVEILRGDLSRILYDATKEHTEYIFGDSITSISEDPDGVLVTFAHAAPRRYDLVVGADGVHSNVRALAFGPESEFVSGLGLHCAIFTIDNYLGLNYTGMGYSTPGKVVAVYSARHNTEAKTVLYFGSPSTPYDRDDIEQQQRIVTQTFAGNGWETARLLAAMREAPDFYIDSLDQVHLDTWSRGRVVLLGDAAYCASPLSGMGTGLAVVGAYVLAGELAAARGDHRTGFARYQEEMRAYVNGCQKMGQGVSRFMVPQSRFMAWFMNVNYKLIPYLPWKGLMASSARKVANGITLKTYATPSR